MAARRVSLHYLLTAVVLSVGAAAATFQLKHEVRDVEHELGEVGGAIAQERWLARSARADLAYLTRPERIVMQAEQLGMVPVRGGRLLQPGQIPTEDQLQFANAVMAATLPSGAEVDLRLKPLPLLALAAPRGRR